MPGFLKERNPGRLAVSMCVPRSSVSASTSAAPIPDMTPSPDRNSFLHEVAALVESGCQEVGAKLA